MRVSKTDRSKDSKPSAKIRDVINVPESVSYARRLLYKEKKEAIDIVRDILSQIASWRDAVHDHVAPWSMKRTLFKNYLDSAYHVFTLNEIIERLSEPERQKISFFNKKVFVAGIEESEVTVDGRKVVLSLPLRTYLEGQHTTDEDKKFARKLDVMISEIARVCNEEMKRNDVKSQNPDY